MIPVSEARDRVLRDCRTLPVEQVRLASARGLVTAEAVVSAEFVPPFANSAMDGFAVRSADTSGASEETPVRLTVVDTVAAGTTTDTTVEPQQAIRIMTGAPVPAGADAVVMVERCRASHDGREVDITVEVPPGNHIRSAGDDLQPGDEVIAAGTTLSAGHLGVLAGLGCETVAVHRRARVGVVSTGDELVEGPVVLQPGQIRDSNRVTLIALLDELGCETVDLGIAPDDEATIRSTIERGVADCDALVTSGGVSMGDFDYVKAVLDELGDMNWMQVAIRPAKPLAFGLVGGVPVFGLPGNPVSSMVSFELFVRPALRQMMGHHEWGRQVATATAPDGFARRPDGKIHFVRVRIDRDGAGLVVRSAGGQGSHQLSVMASASGLAIVPDGEGVEPGGSVEVILLSEGSGPLPG